MSGSGDYISREALVNEIWKALYSYEDEMEAKFMADPELDVSQWFFHRIFVQTMSSIDLQVILDAPAADVRPVVLCRDCVNYVESGEDNGEKMCVIDADWCSEIGCYYGFTACTPPDWFCAGGKKREES